jgi:LDH2 family malate/lactate/ureidoglycolate dehydrogenase
MVGQGVQQPVVVTEAAALDLMVAVAERLGINPKDALILARHLVDDELRGAAGMSRIFIVAEDVARDGPHRCHPITIHGDSDITASVDGGGHHGLVVAEIATELAISKAKEAGVAVVTANNHRYSGTLGYYAEMVARRGLIALTIASGSFGSVAPYGAREGRLDTNPIACGFPTEADPIVWDIATSAISGSEVYKRVTTGQALPEGVAVGPDGLPTVDPVEALAGALLPWGGHRGSGLAMVVRLLSLLAGVPAFPARSDAFGFLMIAIDPGLFLPGGRFEQRATEFAAGIRATPASGIEEVRVPFDRSLRERERRRHAGIELPKAVFDRLSAIRDGASGAG